MNFILNFSILIYGALTTELFSVKERGFEPLTSIYLVQIFGILLLVQQTIFPI